MNRTKRVAILAAVVAIVALTAGGAIAHAASAGPVVLRSSLYNGGRPCSTDTTRPLPLGFLADTLAAYGSDTHRSAKPLRYTFRIQPTDGSEPATDIGVDSPRTSSAAFAEVPPDALHDGAVYSWRVRVSDSNGTSPWSQTCVFGVDMTPPPAPAVSSPNFPSGSFGPVGRFARFRLSGAGDRDVAGFVYTWSSELSVPVCSIGTGPQGQTQCPDPFAASDTVRANTPGGVARLALSPPYWGPVELTVAAVDAAGNQSGAVRYGIYVPDSGPTVTTPDGSLLCDGDTTTLTLTPHPGVHHVTSYRYAHSGQSSYVVVPAARDGSALVHLADVGRSLFLDVTSVSASGYVSTPADTYLHTADRPSVSSDDYPNTGVAAGGIGVAGAFRFTAPVDLAVARYRYHVGAGSEGQLRAGSDGGAVLHYAPRDTGPQTLVVTAESADGKYASCPASYAFDVAGSPSTPPTTPATPPPSAAPPTSGAPSTPGSEPRPRVVARSVDGTRLAGGATLGPGTRIGFSLSGFTARASIHVSVHSNATRLATVRANGRGQARYRFTVPANLPDGAHRLTFAAGGRTAAFRFTLASTGPQGDGLPLAGTGVDAWRLVSWAVAFVIAGFACLRTARWHLRSRPRHR